MDNKHVIVPLDFPDAEAALALAARLDPALCRVKVGKEPPGIRLEGSSPDDQSRVVTPREALRLGADYLVIGRPIAQARDPVAALESIRSSLTAQTQ